MDTDFFLVLRNPDFPQRERPLPQGKHILGRSKDCDIVIFDWTVSRQHARVCVKNDVVTITDLGSRNGTHIGNNQVAAEEVLSLGSPVRFGRIECILGDSLMLNKNAGRDYSTVTIDLQDAEGMRGQLSDAERRVLPYLLEGLSEKEVAHHLSLSPNTIHHHISAIYRTLHVSSRGELLAQFLRNGNR